MLISRMEVNWELHEMVGALNGRNLISMSETRHTIFTGH